MDLPFVNRARELARLARAFAAGGATLCCLYGRRRLGKSRLVQEAVRGRAAVYYVGDERDAPLQRASLAEEIERLIPGFAGVRYPDWGALLDRWWADAPRGAVLVLDEFPFLAGASRELPGLLQKYIDRRGSAPPRLGRGSKRSLRSAQPARHLVVCGSSQRMMQGLVLDPAAPLYGRARELIRVDPLEPRWLAEALRLRGAARVVEYFAAWGGVPRYWELAAEHADLWAGVRELVLDPLGVLHREPERLLLDDIRDTARVSSILALVGQGCHRPSEVAGRLGLPSTSLARPLARLVELGLVARDCPFGEPPRASRRGLYRIADPFLRFWFRFVEPNRSRLAAGRVDAVLREVQERWPAHLGEAWEDLARWSVARLEVAGARWKPALRWWGRDRAGAQVEIDIVAEEEGGSGAPRILVGEARRRCAAREARALAGNLARRAAACPALAGREILPALWILERPPAARADLAVIGAAQVVDAGGA